jgi:exopolysaccharide biosynthesis polyprenyl glycosylphosphotransferase
MLLGDAAIVLLAFVVGIYVRVLMFGARPIAVARRIEVWGVIPALVIQLISLFVSGLYDLNTKFTPVKGLIKLAFAVLVTLLAVAALFFFAGHFVVGRTVLLVYFPTVVFGTFLWRSFFFNSLLYVGRQRRMALAGVDGAIEELLQGLDWFPVEKYNLVDIISEGATDSVSCSGTLPVISCTAETLPEIVEENDLDILVYSLSNSFSDSFRNTMLSLHLNGLVVRDLPSFYGELIGKIPADSIDTRWVLESIDNNHNSGIAYNTERVFEFTLASLLLILTFPLFILIALAIKIDSPGPVIFKQERLGLHKEPFVVYKFRTMVENAEAETGPIWAEEEDSRVTRVGRFLRKTRLDELPQLINILKGEMSFVGFRPIRQHFADMLADIIPFYSLRFSIKPGLTGWPQVQHDYSGSVEGQKEKFEYELFYLVNRSPFLDLFIFLKTIQVVIFERGQ